MKLDLAVSKLSPVHKDNIHTEVVVIFESLMWWDFFSVNSQNKKGQSM